MTQPIDRVRRHLRQSKDIEIALLAADRGIIRREVALEWLHDVEANRSRPLLEFLRQRAVPDDAMVRIAHEVQLAQLRELVEISSGALPDEVAAVQDDPASRVGKYVLVSELGRGGMAVVYRAWQTDLGRWVALKRLKGFEGGSVSLRFFQEARVAARLTHPNLVPVYEVGEDPSGPFISMALIDGGSLAGREMPPRKALQAVAQAARAVQVAHQAGIVHRDIKPANLLQDNSGNVYLTDFGLARVTAGAAMSGTGVMLGTVSFAPPEQIRGEQDRIGPQSDVYSLGATLYALISGQVPFPGNDVLEVARQTVESEAAPLRRYVPGLHADLQTICGRAMRKKPEDRYPSAEALAEDIDRYLNGKGILARPPKLIERMGRGLARRWAVVAIAVVAAALIIPGVIHILDLSNQKKVMTDTVAMTQEAREELRTAERLLDSARRIVQKPTPDFDAYQVQLQDAFNAVERARKIDAGLRDLDFVSGSVRIEQGDLVEAEKALTRHVARFPDDARGFNLRGQVRLDRAFWNLLSPNGLNLVEIENPALRRDGVSDMERTSEIGGAGYGDPVLTSGYVALLDGQYDKAMKICDDRLKNPPVTAEFLTIRAVALSLMRRGDEAFQDFTAAVKASSTLASARMGRVLFHQQKALYEEALKDITFITQLRPRFWLGHMLRGQLFYSTRRYEKSLACYESAIEFEPRIGPTVMHFRLNALLFLKRYEDATRLSINLAPHRHTYIMAMMALSKGNRSDSMDLLNQSIEAQPSTEALVQRAQMFLEDGDKVEEAMRDLNLGITLKTMGFPAKAHALRGKVYLIRRDNAAADADYTLALTYGFQEPWVYVDRATIRIGKGHRKEAIADLNDAIRRDPDCAPAYETRGLIYLNAKKFDEALADLSQAVKLNPSRITSLQPWIDQARAR